MQLEIVETPLDARALEARVAHPSCGAVLSFVGLVRDHHAGRAVTGLDYQAYPAMCQKVAQQIGAEIADRWPSARVTVAHRVGSLAIGEASIVIATAAPHRVEAYEASRYCIDRIKAILPVWKREHYIDGEAQWVSNPEFQPEEARTPCSPS
jgi:molybdopterin synthase catalytic subunit